MAVNQILAGFYGVRNLFSDRITQVGSALIGDLIRQSALQYTNQANILTANWATRSAVGKEKVKLPGATTLQPIDEWGNPEPVRGGGSYDAGYPIQGGGTAWGTNRVSAALMTVQEANDNTFEALAADADWMKRHMIAAILSNVEWAYDDDFMGELLVKPLANGDTVRFLKEGVDGATTDNHYIAQLLPIDDANNPIPSVYRTLQEHASNTGPFVLYCSTSVVEKIEMMTALIERDDPDVQRGLNQDTLTMGGLNPIPQILGPGSTLVGKMNRMFIVEWKAIPAGYAIGVAVGAGPFLRQREYDSPALQGFFPEFHSPDGNLSLNKFIRYAGFGVRNRIAAVALQMGSATYVTPATHAAPLKI